MNRRTFVASASAALIGGDLLRPNLLGAAAPPAAFSASQKAPPPNMKMPSLKQLGSPCGMKVGMACSRGRLESAPAALINFFSANFNILSPEGELKWRALRPSLDTFDFVNADWMVDFAARYDMKLRGHNLCWNTGNPKWVQQTVNKQNAEKILVDHITKVAGRYKGKLDSWDVVNEPIALWFNKPGGYYPGPWFDALGPQYIDVAFHATAAADPDTLRVINVHHIEQTTDDAPRRACLQMLEDLLKRNVPVQALGLESHLDCNLEVDKGTLGKFIHEVRGMGLEIAITEMDINDAKVDGTDQTRDRAVADYYRNYLDIILPISDLKRLVFWSLEDNKNWMDYMCDAPRWQRADGRCNHRPSFLDPDMHIKASYLAVVGALQTYCKP
jgi:endo-1,4-beta-xylanase